MTARQRGQPVDVLDGEHRSIRPDTFHGEPHRGDPARFDRRHPARDAFGGIPGFVSLADVVEFDVELPGEVSHQSAEQGRDHARLERHGHVVLAGTAEPHRGPGVLVVVVISVVEDLLHGHRPCAGDQAQCRVHGSVRGVPGVDSVDVQGGTSGGTGLLNGVRNQSSACRGTTSHTIEVPTTLMPALRKVDISSIASIGRVSPRAV